MFVTLFDLKGEPNYFFVDKTTVTIGRDSSNDVCFFDSKLSKFHAEFFETDSGLAVMDLGSTNGTYVIRAKSKKDKIDSNHPYLIKPNTFLHMGSSTINIKPGGYAGIEDLVNHNLNLMSGSRKTKEGGMVKFALNESKGGNAGLWSEDDLSSRVFECVAANFRFNPSTGVISGFTNSPREYSKGGNTGRARFRIVMDSFKIVDVSMTGELDNLAESVLAKTLERYNYLMIQKTPLIKLSFLDGARKGDILSFCQFELRIGSGDNIDVFIDEPDFSDLYISFRYFNDYFKVYTGKNYDSVLLQKNFWFNKQVKENDVIKSASVFLIGETKLKLEYSLPD